MLVGPASGRFVANPAGVFRVAVAGSSANAGRISGDLEVEAVSFRDLRRRAASGRIAQGEVQTVEFEMPAGVSRAIFELLWSSDWSRYPTDDLDLFVISPSGVRASAATLNAPELRSITLPEPGTWTVQIDGFTVHELSWSKRAR